MQSKKPAKLRRDPAGSKTVDVLKRADTASGLGDPKLLFDTHLIRGVDQHTGKPHRPVVFSQAVSSRMNPSHRAIGKDDPILRRKYLPNSGLIVRVNV
jgi:hypothetical protein